MSSPEQLSSSPESVESHAESAAERLEALEKRGEQSPERSGEQKERAVETARAAAAEQAISKEKGGAEKGRKEPSGTPRRHGTISRKEKDASFKRHMKQVQSELSAPSRAFSKIIHNKAVEKTSDFIGATIARPDAILSGAITAFLLVLAVYLLARGFGYVLSGFETIAAFIIGWVLGIVYDYLKSVITGKPS